MKFIFVVLALLFTVGSSEDASTGFIIGGVDTTIEEHPYMAGITRLGLPWCGGTIISSRSVLTAAHCIGLNLAPAFSVFVGSSRRRGQGGVTLRAIRIVIHPEYRQTSDPFTIDNDVAVIRTIRDIVFGSSVQSIPLGEELVPAGSQVILTGWGLMGDSIIRDRAHQLQKLEMIAIPNVLCELLYLGTGAENAVSDEMLCLHANGGRGGCSGDSGGPITWQGTVVGILSWGSCGVGPTVFIRVSHHVEWIHQQL